MTTRGVWFYIADPLLLAAPRVHGRISSFTIFIVAIIIMAGTPLMMPDSLRNRKLWIVILSTDLMLIAANSFLTGHPLVLYDDALNSAAWPSTTRYASTMPAGRSGGRT